MDKNMDWFARYWELDPGERAEFLAYARNDGELAGEVEEIEFFEEALQKASRISHDPLSDEALLFYMDRAKLDHTSAPIAHALSIIESALRGNADAMRRFQVMESRMKHFDQAVPVAPGLVKTGWSDEGDGVTVTASSSPGLTSEPRSTYRVNDGGVVLALLKPLQHVLSTAVACAAVYLVLFTVSFLSSPRETRLAYLASDDVAVELLLSQERGDLIRSEEISRILEGASLLRQAQTSTLGLFPHYDREGLAEAAIVLEELYAESLPENIEPFTAYFLGKLLLAEGDVYKARHVLRSSLGTQHGSIDDVIENLLRRVES